MLTQQYYDLKEKKRKEREKKKRKRSKGTDNKGEEDAPTDINSHRKVLLPHQPRPVQLANFNLLIDLVIDLWLFSSLYSSLQLARSGCLRCERSWVIPPLYPSRTASPAGGGSQSTVAEALRGVVAHRATSLACCNDEALNT